MSKEVRLAVPSGVQSAVGSQHSTAGAARLAGQLRTLPFQLVAYERAEH